MPRFALYVHGLGFLSYYNAEGTHVEFNSNLDEAFLMMSQEMCLGVIDYVSKAVGQVEWLIYSVILGPRSCERVS